VGLPRLGRPRVQLRQAVRSVHRRAARRRPAAEPDARPARRHRVQPLPRLDGRGGLDRAGGVYPQRLRPGGHQRLRLPRPDGRLRPLPRPQVRPHQPERVLPVLRLLQQHRRPGARRQQVALGAVPAHAHPRAGREDEGAGREGRRAEGEGRRRGEAVRRGLRPQGGRRAAGGRRPRGLRLDRRRPAPGRRGQRDRRLRRQGEPPGQVGPAFAADRGQGPDAEDRRGERAEAQGGQGGLAVRPRLPGPQEPAAGGDAPVEGRRPVGPPRHLGREPDRLGQGRDRRAPAHRRPAGRRRVGPAGSADGAARHRPRDGDRGLGLHAVRRRRLLRRGRPAHLDAPGGPSPPGSATASPTTAPAWPTT